MSARPQYHLSFQFIFCYRFYKLLVQESVKERDSFHEPCISSSGRDDVVKQDYIFKSCNLYLAYSSVCSRVCCARRTCVVHDSTSRTWHFTQMPFIVVVARSSQLLAVWSTPVCSPLPQGLWSPSTLLRSWYVCVSSDRGSRERCCRHLQRVSCKRAACWQALVRSIIPFYAICQNAPHTCTCIWSW